MDLLVVGIVVSDLASGNPLQHSTRKFKCPSERGFRNSATCMVLL